MEGKNEFFKDKFLIYDSNIVNLNEFFNSIYKCTSYKNLPLDEIKIAKEKILKFVGMINFFKCRTINEVVEELQELQRITSDKLKNLNFVEKLNKKYYKNNFYLGKKVFNDFAFTLTNTLKIVKNSRYLPLKSDLYAPLEELVIAISDIAVKDKPEMERCNNIKTNDKKTDAKLIATSYYISLIEDKPVTILSNDHDLIDILDATYGFISLVNKYTFIKKIQKNPLSIYSYYQGKFFFKKSTNQMTALSPSAFHYVNKIKKYEFEKMAMKILEYLNLF